MNVELPAVAKPESRAKQVFKQLFGLTLALLFLWLAFRNTNFNELRQHMQNISLPLMTALSAVGIFSHWLRAWRWTIMLKPVAGRNVGIWNAFCAVMIGYAVNIAVPRGGEVARVVSICKTERIPWVGVLPTMFIDRLLDVAMLVFLLGITMVMLPIDIRETITWLVPTGIALCAATVIGLVMLPMAGAIINRLMAIEKLRARMPDKVAERVTQLSEQFDRGTSSLRDPIGLAGIAVLSFVIWAAYFVSFYLGIMAFNMTSLIDLSHALIIFSIASVSVLVPTPGSLGTYHYAITQAMQKISNVGAAQAAAFAAVFHAVTFVLIVCLVAALCFILQQNSNNSSKGPA